MIGPKKQLSEIFDPTESRKMYGPKSQLSQTLLLQEDALP